MTLILFAILLSVSLVFPPAVSAVCPACTVAVGAGLGLSRWLGIDDAVSGVWVGGLLLSSSLWLAAYLEKKQVRLPCKKLLSIALIYLLTLLPLYWGKVIGAPFNTLWGVDKLLLGTGVGTLAFYLSVKLDSLLRSKNDGKVFVYYQKVILPVVLLLLSSGIFYFITR
ncbi:MAG: hypothetical protein ACOX6V_01975 [Patescibacteria group bacterium]